MCLDTTKTIKSIPIVPGKIDPKKLYSIAKKNIKCWKVVTICDDGTFKALHRYTPYVLNKLYKSKLDVSSYLDYEIKCKKNIPSHIEVYAEITVEAGRHSYSNIGRARYFWSHNISRALIECVIPRGAKYFHSPVEHEYVSDQIILKKVVK